MRILIVGGGEVGTSVASGLTDAHDVVVLERAAERAEAVRGTLDALVVEGDATDLDVLADAGVGDADVAIGATDDDETNLAVCATVSEVSDTFTLAQVTNPNYVRTWREHHGAFGANYLVNSRLRAAHAIARIVDLPMAHDLETFSNGVVHLVEFELDAESPVVGEPMAGLGTDELVPVAVLREGDVHTDSEATTLAAGDRFVVAGTHEAVMDCSAHLTPEAYASSVDDIVLLGGSETVRHVATHLEARGWAPRMVVEDEARAHRLRDDLTDTTILVHDATDPEFLEREHVGDADVVVVGFADDQRGLLGSMLARQQGADRTMTIVDAAEYDTLFEAAGVDVAVHPRAEAAEAISRFTRGRHAENVAIVERGVAEVFEIAVEEGSLLLEHTVKEAEETLPESLVVCAITRDGDYHDPRPSVEFQEGDRVVAFASADVSDDVLGQL
ncbi:Trk system potassium transporter TrkA [Halarchaeum sp. P4]|uniref:Trk system potassium transporter TrkA n=1 Tax=Halarchaeum sp. P4 TaxID=3421639 RepID=UPI003EC0C0D6